MSQKYLPGQPQQLPRHNNKLAHYKAEHVLFEVKDGVATLTMNRPDFHNVQNSQMTYALDACFRRAVDDDTVKVIVLRGAGKHFSAGHDIGSPGRDINKPFLDGPAPGEGELP